MRTFDELRPGLQPGDAVEHSLDANMQPVWRNLDHERRALRMRHRCGPQQFEVLRTGAAAWDDVPADAEFNLHPDCYRVKPAPEVPQLDIQWPLFVQGHTLSDYDRGYNAALNAAKYAVNCARLSSRRHPLVVADDQMRGVCAKHRCELSLGAGSSWYCRQCVDEGPTAVML